MNLNETKINLPVSLGVPRIEMPQVDREFIKAFTTYLDKNNISYAGFKVPIQKLKSTQKEINKEKVLDLIQNPQNIYLKPIIISSDYYIVDGHHRAIAQLNIDRDYKIKVLKIDQTIMPLLDTVSSFPNVRYKDVE